MLIDGLFEVIEAIKNPPPLGRGYGLSTVALSLPTVPELHSLSIKSYINCGHITHKVIPSVLKLVVFIIQRSSCSRKDP